MATLDQPIAIAFEKTAAALILETGKQMLLEIDGSRHPLTKETMTSAQLIKLVLEIMPEGMHPQLENGDGRLAFGYEAGEHRVDVETDRSGENVTVVIAPAKPRRSTAAMSMPAEALLMENAPEPATAASGLRSSAPIDEAVVRAEERIQDLLRFLVESESSDLHLRVGLPPVYRTHGELVQKEGADALSREEIEEMLLSIMPDRNPLDHAGSKQAGVRRNQRYRFRIRNIGFSPVPGQCAPRSYGRCSGLPSDPD